jgi:hypothetical protein
MEAGEHVLRKLWTEPLAIESYLSAGYEGEEGESEGEGLGDCWSWEETDERF